MPTVKLTVKLKIHWDAGVLAFSKNNFETRPLVDLFKSFNIDLDIDPHIPYLPGTNYPSDEKYLDSINFYTGSMGKTPGESPAHLIIGQKVPLDYEGMQGALLDTDSRGVAAVFAGAPELNRDNPELLLRVCAHEIGHMLNLIHENGNNSIPTTMSPAVYREHAGNNPQNAWEKTGAFSSDQWKKVFYPFSQKAAAVIDQAVADNERKRVLPWGGPFKVEGAGIRDTGDYSGRLKIIPDRDESFSGEHFSFTCELQNMGDDALQVPGSIKSEYSSLVICVTRPDGTRYYHRPRTIGCGGCGQVMRKGGKKIQPLLIADGPGYSIFPLTGNYKIEAFIPGVSAPEVTDIKVMPPKNDRYLSKPFLRSLKQGSHTRLWRQRKCLNQIINNGNIKEDPHVAYLAFLKASRMKQEKIAEYLFKEVQNSRATPLTVKHWAVIQRCWRARNTPDIFDYLIKQAFDSFPDKLRDENLHKALNAMLKK